MLDGTDSCDSLSCAAHLLQLRVDESRCITAISRAVGAATSFESSNGLISMRAPHALLLAPTINVVHT